MLLHYNPGSCHPIDGQMAPVGVASGKHWEECRHQWKTLAPGGANNVIDAGSTLTSDTPFGVIGGGQDNMIQPGAHHSSILGGLTNRVGGDCAVVAGGSNNTASGAYSAILGGSGNNDLGFPYAGIFGQNVNAVAPNTFHVECLNAVNTPLAFGPAPSGTVMYKTFATLLATDRVLIIAP